MFAPAAGRVAAVAAASVIVLVLPRSSPVRWWAVPIGFGLLAVTGVLAWWSAGHPGKAREWPWPLAVAHLLGAHAGAGFVGVAAGGIEGNQRFLLVALVVVTAATSSGELTALAWASATVTVYWSAVVGGTPRDVALTVTAMFAPSAAAIAAIVHSVLENQRAQARLASATAALAAAIARCDALDDLVDVLPLASDVLGGSSVAIVSVRAEHEPIELAAYRPRAADEEEQVLITASPGEAYVLVVGWPTTATRRSVAPRTVLVVRDLLGHLVARSRRITVLEVTTMTDPLTGLGNRRAIGEWMQRRGAEATVVLFDLDHFKRFNDTYGHLEGDQLLRRFAATVRDHLRAEDCAARIGGEEFCVALDRADTASAQRFVARVRTGFASDVSRVTFSAGVAEVAWPEGLDEVLARADSALYEAKRTGRDRTVVADR